MTEPTTPPAPRPDLSPQQVADLSTEAMWAGDAASRGLGIQVLGCGPGTARLSMTVREDMVNGWGMCHGGLVATLADSAFAVACNSRGFVTVAAGFDVSFVEAAQLGDELVAEAVEVHQRGRSGLTDVTVSRSDGTVVALFRGRSRSSSRLSPGVG